MKSWLFGILLFNVTLFNLQATPVSQYGAIKKQGAKIVGANGDPVQLAGPSLYWSIWGGQKFYNSNVISNIAMTWNASLIRAAIAVENPGGYLEKPTEQLTYAKTVVDAAITNGIYILVDWHDHNANLHITQSKEFFSEMAKTYKNTPNIIWEIWNEPDNVNGTGTNEYDTWDDIRKYADSIIPEIRKYSSNLIVVGTPNWSSDPASAARNPLEDTNVAYTLHFYAGTHGASVRTNAETAMSKGAAIFITEFGTTDAAGGKTDSTLYFDETKVWLDWADIKGISWANWSLSNIPEPCSELVPSASTSGIWADSDLSKSGKWIRDRLLARPANQSPDSAKILTAVQGNGSITVSPGATQVLKGTEVTFTAVPSEGSLFKSWSDASASTDNPLKLTIEENTLLVAIFTPDNGKNMIKNSDFSSDSDWFFWVDTANGNEAVNKFDNSQANIDITNTDTLNWGIQLSQSNLELDSGATYTITLDAWSTDSRSAFVGLSSAETWHYQGGASIDLTAEKQSFTITITPDSSTTGGIFQINAGGSLLPIYIDNVQMIKTSDVKVINRSVYKSRTLSFSRIGDRIYWTPSSQNTKVMISDMRGRVVQPATISNPVLLTKLTKGTYLFVIDNGVQKQAFSIFR